ncbi:MAG: Yqey-like protein [bacterium ADurb.Bin400]|nr:MAG: Yqey-like protein [bacterium ADurb.Bin400]
MSLQSQIEQDFISAYKAKDDSKISTLRLLKSALKNSAIEKKRELSEDEVIQTIRREVKQRSESAEEYRKGNRTELAEKEEKEIIILKTYLPRELSDTEITEIAQNTIRDLGEVSAAQTGRVIGAVMSKVKGQADGATVSRIVQDLLKNKK